MKIKIVVDANIIISALIGGRARIILFDKKFEFLTTFHTIKEVEKYIPTISQYSNTSQKEIKDALALLPLKIYRRTYYKNFIKESEKLMKKIDPDDVDILALCLKENTYILTEDKHFDKLSNKIRVLKIKDFL